MTSEEAIKTAEAVLGNKVEELKETVRLVDLSAIGRPSADMKQKHLELAAKLTELESAITYAKASGIEWLEVDEDVLLRFGKGVMPEAGYVIYKDVRLCLKDTAELIAKKEQINCHEILFPTEGYMKLGVKSATK